MVESTEYFYKVFKDRVLEGRENLTSEQLDELALGRIWSGVTATKNGLVDEIGGIKKSIEIAKTMAGLDGKEVEIVEYPQKEVSSSFSSNQKNTSLKTKLIIDLLPEKIQEELNKLTRIRWSVTIILEIRDAIALPLSSLLKTSGNAIVYLLTQIIGRSIGLVGKGILQGIGNSLIGSDYLKQTINPNSKS